MSLMKFTSPQERAVAAEVCPSVSRADWSTWKRRIAWPALWIAGKLIRRDVLVVFNYQQVSPVFDRRGTSRERGPRWWISDGPLSICKGPIGLCACQRGCDCYKMERSEASWWLYLSTDRGGVRVRGGTC